MQKYIKFFAVYLTALVISPSLFLSWRVLQRKGFICGFENYCRVCARYFLRFYRVPNFISPNDYNEKIAWLKLFDNNALKVVCCDKYEVRSYVLSKIGKGYLPEIYYVNDKFDMAFAKSLDVPFVVKTTHDQGGVYICKASTDFSQIEIDVRARLAKRYGFIDFEWPYLKLDGKVMYEEFLDFGAGLPDDYKFHCSKGKVKWLQYITDRDSDVKEGIYDCLGQKLDVRLDVDMKVYATELKLEPGMYEKMVAIAEALASEFKYVRVDMYCTGRDIYIGELTFFPLGGLYKTRDIDCFGKLLDFEIQPLLRRVDGGS